MTASKTPEPASTPTGPSGRTPRTTPEGKPAGFAYQAVYRYLVSLINEVETEARVKLPSLRQLSERLNVSISTVQYAYSLLEKEGRVYSQAKSGYYALPVPGGSFVSGGADLLERIYVHSRRPGTLVLGNDEPALLLSLDNPLLLLERELVRQYPRQQQPQLQPFGEMELRAALAVRYTTSAQRYWHADDVYIGADLRSVLETLMAALALKHTTVLVESPCDWVILRLLQAGGVDVVELPLGGNGLFDLEQLEQLLRTQPVKLLLMSSAVNMPRGSLMPAEHRQQIARLLEQFGVWLLENDSHGELAYQPAGARMRDLVDPDRLLVLAGFERFMGCEAPFGYLLSRHFGVELQRHFLLRSFRMSPTRQKAIARLYGSGRLDQHLGILRRLLQERMSQVCQLLQERLPDSLDFVPPQGGATVWARARSEVDMRKVFEHLLEQRIVIAPGELFSLHGLHRDCLRLSSTSNGHRHLEPALGALCNALRLESGP
ncbi:PLP-dependent aminotransferase family protein [Pseudomonas sp. RHF3.3-3]|uniref:Transcriptional regulator with HTH domain and aminotransferase domain n=1 Tax=Pseudomonas asplenii TaxID=53407 RepID=A0A0N0VIJ4_9PSED|nr:PLP-dependent aminotransferase family protein [Pseudomonas fuscovaginae]KPA87526.1 transcriptional regulator with HTH domain and aminotransferase domain [Pseudomonas fuscovaginae]